MGAPPVPVEEHSSVIRARRAVEAALVAEDANTSPASSRRSQATKLPRTVANITDPSSRLMPTRRGFLQGYNAQVAVTSDQIIAAVQVGQSPNDMTAFKPMMSAAEAAARNLYEVTGRPDHTIGVVLADAGYCSDANLASPGPDRLIAISKNRDQLKTARELPLTGPPWAGATPRQAMEHRLRTVEGVALYKRRGATVERDSVGQAFQAVADQEEHIRHAAVAELGQHDHPKLCRLPATASRVANKVGTSTPLRAGR
jgi:hypothetical protein